MIKYKDIRYKKLVRITPEDLEYIKRVKGKKQSIANKLELIIKQSKKYEKIANSDTRSNRDR